MRQLEAAYDVANRVFEHVFSVEAGARALQNEYDLNINSARIFIKDYRSMVNGKLFKRGMSARAIDYFLARISADRGSTALREAIRAIHKHIKYYEGNHSGRLQAIRNLLKRHEANLAAPPLLALEESTFKAKLNKALADPASKRRARLKEAAKMPVKVQRIIEVYQRNPDVWAEVVHRAAGICERCRRPAAFVRKKDGRPYLEVHHTKQLANGGEDTVENAIAICANCHRELHYGV